MNARAPQTPLAGTSFRVGVVQGTIDARGFLRIELDAGATYDERNFVAWTSVQRTVFQGRPGFAVVYTNGSRSTPAVRKLYGLGTPEREGISTTAIVVSTRLGSIVANMVLRLSKPAVEARVFTDGDEAEDWLLGEMQQAQWDPSVEVFAPRLELAAAYTGAAGTSSST